MLVRNTIFLSTLAGLGLSACATVSNERIGTVVVDGSSYQTRERDFDQNGRTVTTGEVRVGTQYYGCNTQRAGGCDEVVRRALASDTNVNGGGFRASSFIIPNT